MRYILSHQFRFSGEIIILNLVRHQASVYYTDEIAGSGKVSNGHVICFVITFRAFKTFQVLYYINILILMEDKYKRLRASQVKFRLGKSTGLTG